MLYERKVNEEEEERKRRRIIKRKKKVEKGNRGRKTTTKTKQNKTKHAGSVSEIAKLKTIWGSYHGGRRPSSDDSFHSPTVIPQLALEKPSIMKRYYRRQTTR